MPENYSHLKATKTGVSLHPAVAKMAEEKVFAEVLENPGKQTSWFKHRIEEIVAEKQRSKGSDK